MAQTSLSIVCFYSATRWGGRKGRGGQAGKRDDIDVGDCSVRYDGVSGITSTIVFTGLSGVKERLHKRQEDPSSLSPSAD